MKVLDVSTGAAGAYCGQMLALSGAEVLSVTLINRGRGGIRDEIEGRILARGKGALAIDISDRGGRHEFLDLLEESDAIVDDSGLFAEFAKPELFARQPALIVTLISSFGQSGPRAFWTGSELVDLAAGGLLFLTGNWDREPLQLAPWQGQLTAGLLAAVATAAELYRGGPAIIDFSTQEAILSMVLPALTEYAYSGVIQGREGKVGRMTRIERSSDGWVYAGPSSPTSADYATFAAFLDIPELAENRFSTPEQRMANWSEHQELILPRLQSKTTQEWIDQAAEWRLTFGLVQTTADIMGCPVLQERKFFTSTEFDGVTLSAPSAPYIIDGERPQSLTFNGLQETNQERQ